MDIDDEKIGTQSVYHLTTNHKKWATILRKNYTQKTSLIKTLYLSGKTGKRFDIFFQRIKHIQFLLMQASPSESWDAC